jgi:YD repeat-containing protein
MEAVRPVTKPVRLPKSLAVHSLANAPARDQVTDPARLRQSVRGLARGICPVVTTDTPDQGGFLTAETVGAGTTLAMTTQYTPDLDGNDLTVQDPHGNVTTNSYDRMGQLLTVTDATHNLVEQNTNDVAGQLVQQIGPLGRTTLYAYDLLGRQVQLTDPLGRLSMTKYDAAGNDVADRGPAGLSFTFYDADNRVSSTLSLTGEKSQSFYDPAGHVSVSIDAMNNTSYWTYNDLGQLEMSQDGMGNQTYNGYNADGELTSVTDPMNRTTSYLYDPLKSVEKVKCRKGVGTRFFLTRKSHGNAVGASSSSQGWRPPAHGGSGHWPCPWYDCERARRSGVHGSATHGGRPC